MSAVTQPLYSESTSDHQLDLVDLEIVDLYISQSIAGKNLKCVFDCFEKMCLWLAVLKGMHVVF